jgi:hypothetical protein
MGILGPTPNAMKNPDALLEGGFSAYPKEAKNKTAVNKYFMVVIILKENN